MTIAVLMSTYNGEKYIDQQLESLYNQTIKDSMSIHVRDDGSKDSTIAIIESWKDRLNIQMTVGNNVGPAESFWEMMMNKEISADYYAFCDQDDIWDPDKLSIAMKHLKDNVHLYMCNCRAIDDNGTVFEERRKKVKPVINLPALFVSGVSQGCSMVFTSELRNYIIGMNIPCIPMHDLIVTMYALTYGEVFWDLNPHFSYRFHSNNVVAKQNKSLLEKYNTTIRSWKKGAQNSLAYVAQEILENTKEFSVDDKQYLKEMSSYKYSLKSRFHLCCDKRLKGTNKYALRSYRIKLLLRLL